MPRRQRDKGVYRPPMKVNYLNTYYENNILGEKLAEVWHRGRLWPSIVPGSYKTTLRSKEVPESCDAPPLDCPPAKSNIPPSTEGLQALRDALKVQIVVATLTPDRNFPWRTTRLIADCRYLLEVIEEEIQQCDKT